MNTVSNFMFHCNNCDANRVFVEFPESVDSTANAPRKGSLYAKFTFKETSPPIILAQIDRPMNAAVFTQSNFVAEFLQVKCDFTRKTAVLRF